MNSQHPAVLVVDDEEPVRRLLAQALPTHGFRVLAAASGEEALALFREHGADVAMVLLDVRMPGMDGVATLRALREIDPKVRCCFLAGYPGLQGAMSLLEWGAERFFTKPFMPAELARDLWEMLGGPPAA
jgi:CheY-like chemotaxis protein